MTGLTDDPARDWQPALLSDRKLLELNERLARIRRQGDAFADLSLAPALEARVQRLLGCSRGPVHT